MVEVLWHGRGGQGAFTAARLLGDAVSAAGEYFALAFPSFGPERRGAPVRAFTRFDTQPVGDRSAITRADFVIYLDETLLGPHWAQELKPDGRVLINAPATFDDPHLLALDADRISSEIMGRPQANTALLGALTVLCPAVTLDALIEALRRSLPKRHWEGNEAVLEEAARVMREYVANHPMDTSLIPTADTYTAPLIANATPADNFHGYAPFIVGPAPTDPERYAQTTCYTAPLIVKDNAGWRSHRPVIDAARCTGCRECFNYCPDGALVMGPRPEGVGPTPKAAERPMPHLDGLFCKGCGICARVCPTDAIAMAPERETEGGRP